VTLRFYLDDNVERRVLARDLLKAGVDVVRATDVGNHAALDAAHLAFAANEGRVLLTSDKDFHRIHWEWMSAGRTHAGVVMIAPEMSIGERIRGIAALSSSFEPEALCNELLFLNQWTER
jgi:hypothetical protein